MRREADEKSRFCDVHVASSRVEKRDIEFWRSVVNSILEDSSDAFQGFRIARHAYVTEKTNHIVIPIVVCPSFEVTKEVMQKINLCLPSGTRIRNKTVKHPINGSTVSVQESHELAVIIPNEGTREITARKIYIKLLWHIMILLLVAFVTYSYHSSGLISY